MRKRARADNLCHVNTCYFHTKTSHQPPVPDWRLLSVSRISTDPWLVGLEIKWVTIPVRFLAYSSTFFLKHDCVFALSTFELWFAKVKFHLMSTNPWKYEILLPRKKFSELGRQSYFSGPSQPASVLLSIKHASLTFSLRARLIRTPGYVNSWCRHYLPYLVTSRTIVSANFACG